MKFTWKIAACWVPLMLGGCADFKGMPSLDMRLPEIFQQQPDSPAEAPATLQKDWWKHTDDETLLATIRALEVLNLSLEQAQLRLNAARLDARDYDYLPSLNATTGVQYDHLIKGDSPISAIGNAGGGGASSKKTTGSYSAKLDASWEIPIYGQLGDAANVAEANIAFAEADIEAVRASVISEAIRLYADMRRLQQEIIQRSAILAATQKILEYQKIKYTAGLITDSELGVSHQALLTVQSTLQNAENEKVSRMQQLAKLLGAVTPDDAWKDPAAIPVFDVPNFSDTPLDVLRNRPDIRKAEASVLAAAGELELSKGEMYPKLTLTGSLSQLGNLTGNPLPGTTVQLTGIPSISLPLFDWGKRLAAARIKDEQLSEKASAYRETVIGAMNEVEEFWSAYHTAQKVEQSSEERRLLAASANAHAALLFEQGITSGIEAENARIEAADATIAELQAKADTITRLTALTKALGGTSNPHENPHD